MPINDPSEIKRKILNFLERHGPSLPVHIAKEVGMDMIFTSAFLSELISNKQIKVSNMKVGTSPIYLLPGTESGLEKFSEYIKGKEHEALNLLKEKKFLEDSKQEPGIRVALRQLRDFAKPSEIDGKIIWRYYLVPEEELKEKKESQKEEIKIESKEEVPKPEKQEENKKEINKPSEQKKKKPVKKKTTKKKSSTNDDKFFNKVKEYLQKKDIEILDIMSFNKKDLVLKVNEKGNEIALIAYNKKRITEKDILSAYKKASEMELNYTILSMGEAPKKTQNWVDAAKSLESLEIVE